MADDFIEYGMAFIRLNSLRIPIRFYPLSKSNGLNEYRCVIEDRLNLPSFFDIHQFNLNEHPDGGTNIAIEITMRNQEGEIFQEQLEQDFCEGVYHAIAGRWIPDLTMDFRLSKFGLEAVKSINPT